MTVIQYSVLILIGLASGFAVASGVFAFITMLGIIPRLAARTNTANHVVWYETMIIAGGALGNIWIVFEIPMPLTSIFLAVYGLFAGVYVGCLVMALAEIIYDIIADFSQCAVYRLEFISEARQFCRCRNDCTDYRICQFSSRTGN